MSEHLFVTNNLIETETGVWVPEADLKAHKNFGYSDGDVEEDYLLDIILKAKDISSNSVELERKARDWSSLYHLTSRRANLLKGLSLQPGKRVLEIGCGCGAITRYLAEQGCIVHSVEGSPRRANIAKARTRDLKNVDVVCANATEIVWPEDSYDLVLFVGVLEYSGKFINQQGLTHKESVLVMLNKAMRANNRSGMVYIAIENRVGQKYQYGADEDHYSRPYIGLQNYVEDDCEQVNQGVQTYTKSEWRDIFDELECQHSIKLFDRFYFPFPDYKLPQMCLFDEAYAPEVEALFNRVSSYDPTSSWHMPVNELGLWRQAYREGYAGNIANSFGIVLGSNEIAVNQMFKYKATKYANNDINPPYQVTSQIAKDHVGSEVALMYHEQSLEEKAKLNVVTLEQDWLSRLLQNTNYDLFKLFVLKLNGYLVKQKIDTNKWVMTTDVFVENGKLCFFDDTKEVQLNFKSKSLQAQRLKQLVICIVDFVSEYEYIFNKMRKSMQLDESTSWADFLLEIAIVCGYTKKDWQVAIADTIKFYESYWSNKSIHRWLLQKMTDSAYRLTKMVNAQVYWHNKMPKKDKMNVFDEERSLVDVYPLTFDLKTHKYELPKRQVVWRYDPCDHQLFRGSDHVDFELEQKVHIYSLKLIDKKTQAAIWFIKGEDLINHCQFNNLQCLNERKQIFQVTGMDPQIMYIDKNALKANKNTPVVFEVTLQWLD